MLRPSPNHGTQRLPNDDDEQVYICSKVFNLKFVVTVSSQCENRMRCIIP